MNALKNNQDEVCGMCFGTGFEPVVGRGVRPCGCREEELRARRIISARIPERYEAATFDTFEAANPSLVRALETSKRFAAEFPSVSCGLLFLGDPGVGKTHLAVSVLRAVIERGASGLFYDSQDLLKEIKDSYNPNTHTSEMRVLEPVFSAEVLVLDDLGVERPTEWVQETLTHIVNRRYKEKLITIFTSNYLDNRAGTLMSETLTERIGARFRSRLHEMCRLVTVTSADFREVLKARRGRGF